MLRAVKVSEFIVRCFLSIIPVGKASAPAHAPYLKSL